MTVNVKGLAFVFSLLFLYASYANAITVCSSGADFTTLKSGLKALAPGGTLSLCRGGSFSHPGMIALGDMKGAKITSYGEGPKPIILPSRSGLKFGYGGRWKSGDPPSVSNLVIDGLDFRGDSDPKARFAILLQNGAHDVTIQNCVFTRWGIGVYIKSRIAGKGPHKGEVDSTSNIRIQHNEFRDGSGAGAVLGGSRGLYLGYNSFSNWGAGGGKYNHSVYLGCPDPSEPGGRGGDAPCPQLVEYNTMTGAAADEDGACRGVELVAHGYLNGLVIRNNTFYETQVPGAGCYGIQLSPAYRNRNERMSNVTITDNRFYNVGRWAIEVASLDTLTIRGNKVIKTMETSYRPGAFYLRRYGMQGPEPNGKDMTNVTVEDNLIWLRPSVKGEFQTIRYSDLIPPYTKDPDSKNEIYIESSASDSVMCRVVGEPPTFSLCRKPPCLPSSAEWLLEPPIPFSDDGCVLDCERKPSVATRVCEPAVKEKRPELLGEAAK